MMLPLEEVDLERKDGEELVYVALDTLDAILLPCPYLGGDIVIDGTDGVGFHKLGDVEVEARIVYEDYCVGLPRQDILLTESHIPQDGGQMQEHRDKPHIGEVTIMTHHRTSLCCHQVAAKETELRLLVLLSQTVHQMRCMQIATRLTSYQIVSH
jgi:hypothetical protein